MPGSTCHLALPSRYNARSRAASQRHAMNSIFTCIGTYVGTYIFFDRILHIIH
jgi:hypothetical protein